MAARQAHNLKVVGSSPTPATISLFIKYEIMALTDQLSKDIYILIDGNIHLITERKYKTQGRQGGLIIFTAKNVQTGQTLVKTVKAGTKFDAVDPEYIEMQYLYHDDSSVYFMNTQTYETVSVSRELVGDYVQYLKEGDKYVIMIYDDKVLSMRKNPSVELKVVESVDAVKGNTATAANKMVTTETGYKVKVPLFVKTGDTITINTETGAYTGRA